MDKSVRTVIQGMVGVCMVGVPAWADGFRNPPDTATALGKANQHRVWGVDASSVFHNPANLVEVPSREVQLSGMAGYSHAEYQGVAGKTDTERPWGFLPAASLAWPLPEHDAALALGLHVPFGRQTRWDAQGPFPITTSMAVWDLAPTAAWSLSDQFSLGAGLDLYYGQLTYEQAMGPGSRVEADADGFAAGASFGATWRPTTNQRLALTCKLPFDLKFEGTLEASNLPPALVPSVPESDLDTTFKFPTIVGVGYGLRVAETVRLETNLEWLQFSRNETMAIHAGQNAMLAYALGLANTPQDWDDTWTLGVGAEWDFAPDWTARVGYMQLQSPIPNRTFAPLALDADQGVASVGLGYRHGANGFDLAYAVGLFDKRHVEDNQQPGFLGTYEFEGHLAAVSYTRSF